MSDFRAPASVRQPRRDRFGQAIEPTSFRPHPDHERLLECTKPACRALVIVGGFVDDIDPATYRCLDCRIKAGEVSWLSDAELRADERPAA